MITTITWSSDGTFAASAAVAARAAVARNSQDSPAHHPTSRNQLTLTPIVPSAIRGYRPTSCIDSNHSSYPLRRAGVARDLRRTPDFAGAWPSAWTQTGAVRRYQCAGSGRGRPTPARWAGAHRRIAPRGRPTPGCGERGPREHPSLHPRDLAHRAERGLHLGLVNDEAEVERSEEHTSELQSPYVISYAVFCLNK